MPAPLPLEKQLLHLNLSKGVNERDRPETAEQETCLTRVENLVYDQAGGMVKRPGMKRIAYLDDQSATMATVTRVVPTQDGIVAIASGNVVYRLDENTNQFRPNGTVPEASVESVDFVAGSGANAQGLGACVATSAKYHVVIAQRTVDSSGYGEMYIYIYDRKSKQMAMSYSLTDACAGSGAFTLTPKAIFVGDYLHILVSTLVGGNQEIVGMVIDTAAALPVTAASITRTTLTGTVFTGSPDDIATDGTSVFYSYITSPGNEAKIDRINGTTGAYIDTYATGIATSIPAFIYVHGTNLWYAVGAVAGARSTTDLTTQTVAQAATGVAANLVGFAVLSNGYLYFVKQTGPALGGSTIRKLEIWKSNAASSVASSSLGYLHGWALGSQPFVCNARMLMQVSNCPSPYTQYSSGTVCGETIIDITDCVTVKSGTQTYTVFKPVANIGPYTSVPFSLGGISAPRYLSEDGRGTSAVRVSAISKVKTAERGYSFAVFNLNPFKTDKIVSAPFAGQVQLSGGCQVTYDGECTYETGFVETPQMNVAQGAAGSMAAGLYNYVAVYRFTDTRGNVTYSRCSNIGTVTIAASKKVDVYVNPSCINRKDILYVPPYGPNAGSLRCAVDVYRTTAGGTTYYLVASSQSYTPVAGKNTQVLDLQASGLMYVADNLTDAQVATEQQLFRQPGTPNTSLDRYSPPASNVVCQHKDRLFTTDPSGDRVYYSSFFVDGESPWFNPAFSFFVHGGNGPITGLVSMDGRLFVFKKNAIFVVDGDGPAESGPSGNEFSPPNKLASEYGCVSPRSIVTTTEGIVYRSTRGIEILTRSLQVKWVGDRVQNTCDGNPETTGSCLDSFGRVHIGVAASDPGIAGSYYGINGAELVWDIPSDAWSIFKGTSREGVYGRAPQDMALANLYGKGEVVCYADPSAGVQYADETSGIDIATYVPTVLETSWIRTGQQARQRITDAYFLAKKVGNHAVKISAAYDYNDSYTEYVVWEPNVINALTIEELVLQLSKPQSLAFRIKIEEQAPADTGSYPVGTGLGMAYLGVTFQVMPMVGAPHVSAGSRVGGGGTAYPEPLVSGVCDATGTEVGGVSVRVLGRGFTGATGVTFGTAAATSVVVVSDYEITCVTPAHAVGAVSVTVTGPGGSYSAPAAYTFTSASFAGIASLPLDIWFRDFTALPWTGTASAGTSASAQLYALGAPNAAPAAGALNGHGTAVFTAAAQDAIYLSPGVIYRPAFHFQMLVKFSSLPGTPLNLPAPYANANLFAIGSYMGLVVGSDGVAFYQIEVTAFNRPITPVVAIVPGQWYLLRGGWDGNNVYLTANSVAYPAGVACVGGYVNTSAVWMATNYLNTLWTDMEVAEFMVCGRWFTSAEEAGIKAELNTRYALAL